MEQLSGLDASFLYFETAQAPTHIGSFAIYDQQTAPEGKLRFKEILACIEQRLHLARCFRQKIVHVPFDLDHPYWVEDEDFDLEFHVRHIALPEPGDWRQLCIQVARIHARPLDLTRPLWEMTVIEGLDAVAGVPKGSFCVLTKIHHCAIDGVSGAEITAAIHDLSPDAVPAPPEEPWRPERDPSLVDLSVRTVLNNLRRPLRLARVLSRSAPSIARAVRDVRRQELRTTGPVPRTRFNGTVTAHRVVEGRSFSLQEVRDVKKRVPGATVNDVVLATCGGALRRYLEHHGELPEESLVALAPISVRSDDDRGAAGNQVSFMNVGLGSDIADPLERLHRVHTGTQDSKALTQAVGARMMTDVTQFVPGALAGVATRLYTQLGLANRIQPFANTVITNVPGPQIPLYMAGARLVSLHGMGPVMDGMGLIHPVFSYDGGITISFTSCRNLLPDPAFYAECLEHSFADLRAEALRPRP